MPRDELTSRLDRLAAPASPSTPPAAFLGRVTRRRWTRRARVGLPLAACLAIAGVVASRAFRAPAVPGGGTIIDNAPVAQVAPRPDSLVALRHASDLDEPAPRAGPATTTVREPQVLRALDGYRGPSGALGSELSR